MELTREQVADSDFTNKSLKAIKLNKRSRIAILLFITIIGSPITIVLNIINFFTIANNNWYYDVLKKKKNLTLFLGIIFFPLFFIFPFFSLSFANSVIDKYCKIALYYHHNPLPSDK